MRINTVANTVVLVPVFFFLVYTILSIFDSSARYAELAEEHAKLANLIEKNKEFMKQALEQNKEVNNKIEIQKQKHEEIEKKIKLQEQHRIRMKRLYEEKAEQEREMKLQELREQERKLAEKERELERKLREQERINAEREKQLAMLEKKKSEQEKPILLASNPIDNFKKPIVGEVLDGPGEMGKPVMVEVDKLSPEEKVKYDEGWKRNQYNQYAADMISLDRSLPDFRFPECKAIKWYDPLPTVSVIIIFFNEALSVLLRTAHSVLNRSDPKLLTEIILVDDASTYGII
jgi:hypothetical protein